ncbi:MAG: hypothetical protein A2Y33_09075 [Spirochaetes bacterium GWF1_51_8]|nr:MAG: hypothetical protein A2Y33_09075 [Spirochaetes bacterium GWF1_51_8]
MNQGKAAFDILAILSGDDNDLLNTDVNQIMDFLQEHYDGDIDEDDEMEELGEMTQVELTDRFRRAADSFRGDSTDEDIELMMEYTRENIIGESELPDFKYNLLLELSQSWDFNIDELVEERFNEMDDYKLEKDTEWDDDLIEEEDEDDDDDFGADDDDDEFDGFEEDFEEDMEDR